MKEKRRSKLNWLLVVVIFVVVSVVGLVNPPDAVRAFVENDHLVLEGCNDVEYFIPMDTIEQVTLVEDAEYAADGRGAVCGRYTNEIWGEHVLYVNMKIDACIVVESARGIYVFNVESKDTTKAFYEAFLKIL